MNKALYIPIVMICLLMTACGPSQEAAATQTSGAGTMAAASWTKTPTATFTPTVTMTPTPGAILYSDDFSNADGSAWQQGGTTRDSLGNTVAQYRISEGRYYITNSETEDRIVYSSPTFASGLRFTSGVLSVDFEIIQEVSSPGSGVNFYIWSSPSQQIELAIDSYDNVTLYNPYATYSSEDEFFHGRATLQSGINHVDVAFHEKKVAIYINGAFIGETEIVAIPMGTIGLDAFPSGGGSTTVAFDNLVVHNYDFWEPPTP